MTGQEQSRQATPRLCQVSSSRPPTLTMLTSSEVCAVLRLLRVGVESGAGAVLLEHPED